VHAEFPHWSGQDKHHGTQALNMIPLFKIFMSPEAVPLLQEVLYSKYIGQGPKITKFENALALTSASGMF
jgi:hypothetical protein